MPVSLSGMMIVDWLMFQVAGHGGSRVGLGGRLSERLGTLVASEGRLDEWGGPYDLLEPKVMQIPPR